MKILIATDFSECSMLALDFVLGKHWAADTEICIVNAVEPIYTSYGIAGGYVQPMVDAHHEQVQEARKLLAEKIEQLKKAFPECTINGFVIEGAPAECIIDQAAEWDADLIVLGSHGRKGFERFFLGSVAEKVVAHAPCSVNIVKKKKDVKAEASQNSKREVIQAKA